MSEVWAKVTRSLYVLERPGSKFRYQRRLQMQSCVLCCKAVYHNMKYSLYVILLCIFQWWLNSVLMPIDVLLSVWVDRSISSACELAAWMSWSKLCCQYIKSSVISSVPREYISRIVVNRFMGAVCIVLISVYKRTIVYTDPESSPINRRKFRLPIRRWRTRSPKVTRSHPEMVGNMSRVTLNFDLSKIPFAHF